MPFVPSVKGEIYGLRQGLLPTEPADPIADLSFGEVTSAAFRQENIFWSKKIMLQNYVPFF